jgi:TrmH family RNA methyltransferase
MLGKGKQKYLTSLQQKKKRKSENKFIVEGVRAVTEGLKSDYVCEEIFFDKNAKNLDEILSLAGKKKIKITETNSLQLKKITDTIHPQGVAALFEIKRTRFEKAPFILALERISDPGNLGTIIRTADWFGAKNILLSPDCVEILNPKVVRATMGGIFHINYKIANDFAEELRNLKKDGYEILLADLEGTPVYEHERERKSVLVLGSEAFGPSQETKETADFRITIPKLGEAESLNVSVAGGILIYELTKRKD